MRKTHNILYLAAALVLAACSAKENPQEGKLPLQLNAILSSALPVTKAYDNTFEDGDERLVYLRHTIAGDIGSYTTTTADQAPSLVTVGSTLYWDDFSNSADASTDLRTSGHGLQAFYGYCYNGGTPTTALNVSAGTLGWTLPAAYADADDVKHADLLWAREQPTVLYAHAASRAGDHNTITVPYTHAMSEITVTLTAGEGFTGSPLSSTTLTLNAMSTVTNLIAPTSTATAVPGDENANIRNITMFAGAYESGLTRNYTAIVGPGTKLKVDELLLTITNVADNNYTLKVTGTMVPKDNDADDSNNLAWSQDHAVVTESEKDFILTKPGYNYHLDITVNKTRIAVAASLQDWTTVTATGTGVIDYPSVAFSLSGNNFADEAHIYVYQLLANEASDDAAERTNVLYGTPATTSTYDSSTQKWTNSPEIYWPNRTNQYYFRALSQNSDAVAQGSTDVLWGTTPAHGTASNAYEAGAALGPRTNEVPLAFEHALSQITINLETTTDAAAVDLTGATIAISNLATSGTIAIEDGVVTPGDVTAAAVAATAAPITNLIVIPQTIGNASFVTITLADGTTYKLQLNSDDTAIDLWERGKHYTYTIHLEKEQITFRALVKDWEVVTGSGNANLEWD